MSNELEVENLNLPNETGEQGELGEGKKPKKNKKKRRIRNAIIAFVILAAMYCTAVFSNIPFIEKWRTIYIETAMTTNSHQWMATYFIPYWIIDEVMEKYYARLAAQRALQSTWNSEESEQSETEEISEEAAFYAKYPELDTVEFRNYIKSNSYLIREGYDKILIEDLENSLELVTTKGDPILVVDAENNLVIVGVSGDTYQGKMAIVKNPEQIELAKAKTFGRMGELVDTFGEDHDAILAINASGFADVGGHGTGSQVKGAMIIDGVDYGAPHNGDWKFYGMKYDNRLYVTNYYTENASDYRWGIEFFPALIVDGECVVDGTYGMGIQPRTSVGQAENGDFMMLIVDGRQVGYSLGCTVQDCSDILMRYGAVQGANFDGGSSAVMWYKDRQITKSSSKAGNGRYMPDALIVNKMSNTNSSTLPQQ